MNTAIQDNPISFGLALEILRGRRMEQVGQARRKLRELRNDPNSSRSQIEIAEEALQDAQAAVTHSQRVSDQEAREILGREGVALCKG